MASRVLLHCGQLLERAEGRELRDELAVVLRRGRILVRELGDQQLQERVAARARSDSPCADVELSMTARGRSDDTAQSYGSIDVRCLLTHGRRSCCRFDSRLPSDRRIASRTVASPVRRSACAPPRPPYASNALARLFAEPFERLTSLPARRDTPRAACSTSCLARAERRHFAHVRSCSSRRIQNRYQCQSVIVPALVRALRSRRAGRRPARRPRVSTQPAPASRTRSASREFPTRGVAVRAAADRAPPGRESETSACALQRSELADSVGEPHSVSAADRGTARSRRACARASSMRGLLPATYAPTLTRSSLSRIAASHSRTCPAFWRCIGVGRRRASFG